MPPTRVANQRGRKNRKSKNDSSTSNDEEYPDTCLFCEANDDDEEIFGRKVRKCGITVHYFCMLFSSGLSQRGKTEEDGIYGFLPSDIGKEKSRGARLRCTFCRKNGATIGCVVKNCRKVFHFGCGQKEGALNQYFDSYRSFCTSHRPRQTCPVSDRLSFYGTANSMCVICMNAVEARASNDTLRAPCCKNTWFHRKCIQRQALAAGLYFFKCPLCCNKEIFQAEMLQVGIYIPEQDAAWEMEPHAYQELLEPYNHCDKDSCLCPRGRKYNRDDSKWEIVVCHWCGSQGSHIGCISNKTTSSSPSPSSSNSRRIRWSCQSCTLIDDELRKERKKKKASCSPVNQDSVDVQTSKSVTPSEHVGRKLPVKRSNTLQTPLTTSEQTDGESSTCSPPSALTDEDEQSVSKRTRRRRKRNLWQRGLLLRCGSKKRKVTSATMTQAEASLAQNQTCLEKQSPSSEQVNTENVNPVMAETPRSISKSLGSESASSSSQITEHKHKKRKRCTSLRKLMMESEILLDIKNNKLCDSSTRSKSAPRLRQKAQTYNAPYVLRGHKHSDTSLSKLPYFPNRRTLRSDKTLKGIDLASSFKRILQESSLKSTAPQKKQKLQDGNNNNNNNNTELHLSSDINESCFNSLNDNKSPELKLPLSSLDDCESQELKLILDDSESPDDKLSLNLVNNCELQKPKLPLMYSSSPSSCSVEISRERKSTLSPVFSKCLTKNSNYHDKENSKVLEKMVDCDCISCCDYVIISTDNESEEGDENGSSVIMSVSLNETDPDDTSNVTVSMAETINISAVGHLQEQKCDDPNCDCLSSHSWVYPSQMVSSVNNNVQFASSTSAYGINDSYELALKHLMESAPGPASPSGSSSSVITLTSSSDYESCKSSNELNTNSCPFEVQTII